MAERVTGMRHIEKTEQFLTLISVMFDASKRDDRFWPEFAVSDYKARNSDIGSPFLESWMGLHLGH